MRGTSHVIIGVTLTGAILNLTDYNYGIAEAAIAGIGSLLPDIDEDSSTINKYIPFSFRKFIYVILGGYLLYQIYKTKNFTLLIPAIVSLLIYFSGHRGFTHSIAAAVIFTIAFMKTPTYIYPFIIGYGLHLICDMLNEKGIALLYPIKKMFKSPIHFTMNSLLGRTIELAAVMLSIGAYWTVK